MKKLTVFTPTYNRAYCLSRCYESLKSQSNNEFIWLIIDDGSTDNTEEIVRGWVEENSIEIIYYYQQNQGMHGAHNTAYQLITTELNVCIDSDDWMPNGAVEKILSFWEEYGNDKVSGIIGLDALADGKVIGTQLPVHIESSTLFDLYQKHRVRGDKKLVYRSELTRNYPYPLFDGERYVGLAYKYYLLDRSYEMLLMNEVICNVEYLPDGSSNNMLKQYMLNPKGFAFYRIELMKLPFASLSFKYRQAIHYVSSSLISNNKKLLQESPNKILTICALPFGALLYYYISRKAGIKPGLEAN